MSERSPCSNCGDLYHYLPADGRCETCDLAYEKGAAAEREACAVLVENHPVLNPEVPWSALIGAAAAIRARSDACLVEDLVEGANLQEGDCGGGDE